MSYNISSLLKSSSISSSANLDSAFNSRTRKSEVHLEEPTSKKNKILTQNTNPERELKLNLLKDLEKALIQSNDTEAEKIYFQLPKEDKMNILTYIEKRNQIFPFTQALELNDINQIYPYTPTGIAPYLFFDEYLLPAVQLYLTEVFEIEKTDEIFKAAKACNAFFLSHPYLSDNHPNRNNILSDYINRTENLNGLSHNDRLIELVEKICNRQEELDEQTMTAFGKSPKKDRFVRHAFTHKIFKKFLINNCEGISEAGFFYLLKKYHVKVELFNIKNGDHNFIVIKRKKGSDPKNYKTWGRHCLIIDNWTEKKNIFYAHEIPIYLEAYLGEIDNNLKPVTELYDSNKHELHRSLSSLFSSADLEILWHEQPSDQHILSWHLNKLKEFENAKDLMDKTKIAQEILDSKFKCTQKKNQNLIKELKNQLRFFLDPDYLKVYNLNADIPEYFSAIELLDLSVDIDHSFISRLLIDTLCKIAALFDKDQIEKAEKKLSRLNIDILKEIDNHLISNFDKKNA